MKGKIMKKLILTGTVVLTLVGASLSSACANERDWATVGQVLTGVAVGGLIIAAATDGHVQGGVNYSYNAPAYCPPPVVPCNYYPAPPVVYCPPAVVVQPQPVVYYPAPGVACGPRPVIVYPAHYGWNHGYGYRHDCR